MTGYKEVTEVCTTPFIYLDGSMYEVLIRSLARAEASKGAEASLSSMHMSAACAVVITTL